MRVPKPKTIIAALAAVALVASAFWVGRSAGNAADRSTVVEVKDFGEFWVDDHPGTFQHTFTVANNRRRAVEIVKVVSSCGCLRAEVGKKVLQAGETTTLEIEIDASSSGIIQQGVTLYLHDGTRLQYGVRALGKVKQDFKAICDSSDFTEETGRRVFFQFYLIDNDGDRETEAPRLLSPPTAGIELTTQIWATLERKDEAPGRPTRQIADATLDFSCYDGAFPVRIEFETASSGGKTTLMVYGDRFFAVAEH